MTPRPIVTPRAAVDLDEHADYIAERDPKAARRFQSAAKDAFQLLAEMPEVGSVFELPRRPVTGLRYWTIRDFRNYVIFYRPSSDGIEVIRVLYGAQDSEAVFG
jgi:toxin ParE1/3/4